MMAAAAQAGSEAAGQEVAFVDDEDDEGTNEDDDDDDEGTEAAGDDDDGFRLGIDRATRSSSLSAEPNSDRARFCCTEATGQVVLINQAGTQTPLGANTVGGLTGAQFLSALFGQGRDGLRPRRSRMMAMLQDDDEDEEEEEEDDEDDDDIEVDWMGRRRPRRPNRNWYPVTKSPEPKGVELLRSGDFGRVRLSARIQLTYPDPKIPDRHLAIWPIRRENGPGLLMACTTLSDSPNPLSFLQPPDQVSRDLPPRLKLRLDSITVPPACPTLTGPKWRRTARGSTVGGIPTTANSSTLALKRTRCTSTTCRRSSRLRPSWTLG